MCDPTLKSNYFDMGFDVTHMGHCIGAFVHLLSLTRDMGGICLKYFVLGSMIAFLYLFVVDKAHQLINFVSSSIQHEVSLVVIVSKRI